MVKSEEPGVPGGGGGGEPEVPPVTPEPEPEPERAQCKLRNFSGKAFREYKECKAAAAAAGA